MKQRNLAQVILIIAFTWTTVLNAQVTIGSDTPPNKGALLDLKMDASGTSTKGLALPRVELKDIRTSTDLAETMGLTPGSLDPDDHIALIVYNTGIDETSKATRFCPGIHIWDGSKWEPLVPYSEVSETRTLFFSTLKGFTYLDPTNASDPMWTTLGKKAADYPLGYIGTFKDSRPNDVVQSYHYGRFYVGYTTSDDLFSVTNDLSCAQDGSKIVPFLENITDNLTFEDGVWMTENLRAERMPDGTALTLSAATGPGQTPPPYYHYPNLNVANKQYGVLYNWNAAFDLFKNVPSGDPDQGGLNERAGSNMGIFLIKFPIQGICPDGWSLPSDRQWTDLENAIIMNTSKFSNTANIGVANILSYTTIGMRGTAHGMAMKSTTPINSVPTGGTSATANQGGFDGLMIGLAHNGLAAWGTDSGWWTASNYGVSASSPSNPSGQVRAYYREVSTTLNGFGRYFATADVLLPVRCKHN